MARILHAGGDSADHDAAEESAAMFPTWRIQLKAAETALRAGRYEEASRLIAKSDLRDYRPGAVLAAKAAGEIAARGLRRLEGGDAAAAWQDLESARELSADDEAVVALRRMLTESAETSLGRLVDAGDLSAAQNELAVAAERRLESSELRRLAGAVTRWRGARKLARQGEFAAAAPEYAAVAALLDKSQFLATERLQADAAGSRAREIEKTLHHAFADGRWNDVLAAADELLAAAPEHARAKRLREQAWRWAAGAAPPKSDVINGTTATQAPDDSKSSESRGARFMLWIDEVGGFLVCLGDAIVLGQPTAGAQVDVPLLADVSRRHAVIRREGEGYVIAPTREISVNGARTAGASLLTEGAEIELAPGATMTFRRPHALSASARLELSTGARTQPRVDGVLLMAETLVLGPGPHCHIVCRNWSRDVVLFRSGDQLGCRVEGEFECDGEPATGRRLLHADSRVSGQDFAFRVESV